MIKLNYSHFILIIFAIAALVLSATGYVVLYRLVVSKAEGSSQALALVAVENERQLHEQEIMTAYTDSTNDRSRLSSFILSSADIVSFIEAVEKIGTDSGTVLDMTAIDQQPAVIDAGSFGYVTAHIDISGSWPNVMRALTLIENMPYSITLSNLNLATTASRVIIQDKKLPKLGQQWDLTVDIKVLTTK